MYRFCQCKYSFKLTCLQRKLELYTLVHIKIRIFVALLNPINRDAYLRSYGDRTRASSTT